jgi:hypothetical protein
MFRALMFLRECYVTENPCLIAFDYSTFQSRLHFRLGEELIDERFSFLR